MQQQQDDGDVCQANRRQEWESFPRDASAVSHQLRADIGRVLIAHGHELGHLCQKETATGISLFRVTVSARGMLSFHDSSESLLTVCTLLLLLLMTQGSVYANCVAVKSTGHMGKDACAEEFAIFKSCVQKAFKRKK